MVQERQQVATPKMFHVERLSPFPRDLYSLVRKWIDQFPDQMADDFWPREKHAFASEMDQRRVKEHTWLVLQDGEPVGFIGYAGMTPHLASLRGICFSKHVHGNGTALRALRACLQEQFDAGVYKICAYPFADNARSIAFYRKLGAKTEGLFRGHTTRGGRLTDVLAMAFFASQDAYWMGGER